MKRECPVHQTKLKHGTVRIGYGMPPAPPDDYFETMETTFPYSKMIEMGGCVVDDDSPDTRYVYFCPDCRAAEAKWKVELEVEDFWK